MVIVEKSFPRGGVAAAKESAAVKSEEQVRRNLRHYKNFANIFLPLDFWSSAKKN